MRAFGASGELERGSSLLLGTDLALIPRPSVFEGAERLRLKNRPSELRRRVRTLYAVLSQSRCLPAISFVYRGETVDRSRISFDPGNAGARPRLPPPLPPTLANLSSIQDRNSLYYSDILLDDLIDRTVSDRVALNLGGSGGATASGAEGGEGGGKGLMDEVQAQKTLKRTREMMEDWEMGLGEVSRGFGVSKKRRADTLPGSSYSSRLIPRTSRLV
jgi:hypothetical protein